MFAQSGQVAFGMALPHIHRQIRHQLGKVRVLAIRPGADRTAHMVDHLLHRIFDTRARLLRQLPRIGAWLAVDLRGAGA